MQRFVRSVALLAKLRIVIICVASLGACAPLADDAGMSAEHSRHTAGDQVLPEQLDCYRWGFTEDGQEFVHADELRSAIATKVPAELTRCALSGVEPAEHLGNTAWVQRFAGIEVGIFSVAGNRSAYLAQIGASHRQALQRAIDRFNAPVQVHTSSSLRFEKAYRRWTSIPYHLWLVEEVETLGHRFLFHESYAYVDCGFNKHSPGCNGQPEELVIIPTAVDLGETWPRPFGFRPYRQRDLVVIQNLIGELTNEQAARQLEVEAHTFESIRSSFRTELGARHDAHALSLLLRVNPDVIFEAESFVITQNNQHVALTLDDVIVVGSLAEGKTREQIGHELNLSEASAGYRIVDLKERLGDADMSDVRLLLIVYGEVMQAALDTQGAQATEPALYPGSIEPTCMQLGMHTNGNEKLAGSHNGFLFRNALWQPPPYGASFVAAVPAATHGDRRK